MSQFQQVINGKNLIKVFIFVSKDTSSVNVASSIHINKTLINIVLIYSYIAWNLELVTNIILKNT